MRRTVLITMLTVLLSGAAYCEEGDFFFAPEFGWSHSSSGALNEGLYAGAHFAYDTSKHLSVEVMMFYGDNNGKGTAPDLKYVLGGGGVGYKYMLGKFKPSLFAGANVAAMDFSGLGRQTKGGMYFGGSFEYYLNMIMSIGIVYKYTALFKSSDLSMLGLRLGFEF